jgi:hypothetical protein
VFPSGERAFYFLVARPRRTTSSKQTKMSSFAHWAFVFDEQVSLYGKAEPEMNGAKPHLQ